MSNYATVWISFLKELILGLLIYIIFLLKNND